MRLTLKQGLALAFVAFSFSTLVGAWGSDTGLRALTAEESQLVAGGRVDVCTITTMRRYARPPARAMGP
jgi:hypothetical protein